MAKARASDSSRKDEPELTIDVRGLGKGRWGVITGEAGLVAKGLLALKEHGWVRTAGYSRVLPFLVLDS